MRLPLFFCGLYLDNCPTLPLIREGWGTRLCWDWLLGVGYGRVGITPGLKRSERSVALAASPRNGDVPPVAFTWKISCMVRRSEEWE